MTSLTTSPGPEGVDRSSDNEWLVAYGDTHYSTPPTQFTVRAHSAILNSVLRWSAATADHVRGPLLPARASRQPDRFRVSVLNFRVQAGPGHWRPLTPGGPGESLTPTMMMTGERGHGRRHAGHQINTHNRQLKKTDSFLTNLHIYIVLLVTLEKISFVM